jgi:hypothetical protein
MAKKILRLRENSVTVPVNFGNGSKVNHIIYGVGKCVGFVRGTSWRIEFDNGQIRDFIPSKLFSNLVP